MRTAVLHPAGWRAARAGADGAALGTRKLVSADRPHRSAGRPVPVPSEADQHSRGVTGAGGRYDPDRRWSPTCRPRRPEARRAPLATRPADAP